MNPAAPAAPVLSDQTQPEDFLLGLRSVSKAFGSIRALVEVDFDLRAGEIVAVVGDNGAGKSTMVKILSGVYPPDDGTVLVRGQGIRFRSPADAYANGIATVFQDLALVEALDVARNVFLGREPSRLGIVARTQMDRETLNVFTTFGINVPSISRTVALLSGGQRQGVAIARAVLRGGAAVIMDEPTAALGVRETAHVLDIVRRLRDQGRGVVVVSHNLELVFDVADRIHVMRLGRTAGVREATGTDHAEIVSLIMGAKAGAAVAGPATAGGPSS
jgi:ABC-type sugar transport system ATPase subunit